MYLMYVDESGDSGLVNSPTNYFGLSAIVVHELDWKIFIDTLITFRKTIRIAHGLPMRTEIHASEYVNKQVHNLRKHTRLAILRNLVDELAKFRRISVTNVIVDKQNKPPTYDVFTIAWQYLFQRFENTLVNGNFPRRKRSDYGIIITDNTNGRKLMRLTRRMAVFNYIPHLPQYGSGSRNVPITRIIEDPHGKDSASALPVQACDVCAYFLLQRFNPNSYIHRQHARYYFDRLRPVLNSYASTNHPLGIVII